MTIKLSIDGKTIEVPAGSTVLQAAQHLGVEVPVFCYHQRLDIAGNCRMCLVEMDGSPKPIASCAMAASEGMVIRTTTPMVHKARKGVLEFLLMHHPLDCPICDQGGECDLQDITLAYGPGESRYEEAKRAVPDKYMGPLIKTFMTRCIHCTRCVRFGEQIAGMPELALISRGEKAEITTYLDSAIRSELSGNLVDVCPVGALTSRPTAFRERPWELTHTDSIDVLDAVGSNISVHSNGQEVKRILPRLHEDLNEEWISDKTRYACDGLRVQRLDTPYIREKGKLRPATWEEAFQKAGKALTKASPKKIAALIGDLADCESILALKDLMTNLGSSHIECRIDGAQLSTASRSHYLFNTTLAGLESVDFCLLIGTNVRADAAMVHARLRKRYLQGGFKVAYLGGALPEDRDFTFAYENLGTDPKTLDAILKGTHPVVKQLKASKNPILIIGSDALRRSDGNALLAVSSQIAETYDLTFNVLHRAASRVGALELGCVSPNDIVPAQMEVLYLLGVDTLTIPKGAKPFIIYQGHHGDQGAEQADVIFPGAAYTEKNATYLNTEGRMQRTHLAITPPGEAKEDWTILHVLSEYIGKPLPYTTLAEIRAHLAERSASFLMEDQIVPALLAPLKTKSKISTEPFAPSPFHFYRTDVISQNSPTLAKCVEELERKAHA